MSSVYQVSFISQQDQSAAADKLGVKLEVVEAVCTVEARGRGFLRDSNLPIILFEGHIFHKETGGKHSAQAPDISYAKWTKQHYKGGRGEYDRLQRALSLDLDAALNSASWGMFQIMGFNHSTCGFSNVRDYVNAQATGEAAQLDAFVNFILANPAMTDALRQHNWAAFARRYNGPAYAKNEYDVRLERAWRNARDANDDPERRRIKAVQMALNAALGAALSVDGWDGKKTQAALSRFQRASGLPETGTITEETLAALQLED